MQLWILVKRFAYRETETASALVNFPRLLIRSTFSNDPVPDTSKIQNRFFTEKVGG